MMTAFHFGRTDTPALQKRHEEYEEQYVKPSRIWIEMTGDHTHYTNDFRLIMILDGSDDWFHARPRTEYAKLAQLSSVCLNLQEPGLNVNAPRQCAISS